MDALDKKKLQDLILEKILALKDKVLDGKLEVKTEQASEVLLKELFNDIDEQFGTSISQQVESKYSELYKIVKREGD